MKNIKKLLKKLFFLPPVPTLLIGVPSYGLVIYALAAENVNKTVAYVAYILSAYALITTVTGIYGIVVWVKRGVEEHPFVKKLMGISWVNRYLKEDTFRVRISLYPGFFINLLYAGIKMFSGIYYRSVWFATLAVYYILLAIMRFFLLQYVWKRDGRENNEIAEWRRYRLCGIILLFMNWALTGIVILVIHQNSGFEYPGTLIYVMAMYAFYAIIIAVLNVIKFRKYGSPVLSAAKVISLTAALVSMLSLETAMLTQFGQPDDTEFRQVMMAATGLGISVIVLVMAVYMIIRSTRQLNGRKLKSRR